MVSISIGVDETACIDEVTRLGKILNEAIDKSTLKSIVRDVKISLR